MRILIRTSKTARWARRIASFALPLTVLPVLMHRERLIDTPTFHLIEEAALLVAALGFIVSIWAFARIWHTGDHGWSKAVTGFILSILCLLPAAYGLTLFFRYPAVGDISTDPAAPVPMLAGIAPPAVTEAQGQVLAAAFPNVRTRRYPLPAPQMFALVEERVAEEGWEIRVRREPVEALGGGQLNAVVTTWLGWRDEVGLRVSGDPEGSRVDMRSLSLFQGRSDLGANGTRIEQFLTSLDGAVTLQMRDNPTITAPVEPEPEPEEPADGGAAG